MEKIHDWFRFAFYTNDPETVEQTLKELPGNVLLDSLAVFKAGFKKTVYPPDFDFANAWLDIEKGLTEYELETVNRRTDYLLTDYRMTVLSLIQARVETGEIKPEQYEAIRTDLEFELEKNREIRDAQS